MAKQTDDQKKRKNARFIWTEGEKGNVEHIARHNVTPAEVEQVFRNSTYTTTSRSSGLPMVAGETSAGRRIYVVFRWIDDTYVVVITAY